MYHSLNYNYQSAELTDLRHYDTYWQAQHRNLAMGTLRRVDRSFQNMFRRIKRGEKAGYPDTFYGLVWLNAERRINF